MACKRGKTGQSTNPFSPGSHKKRKKKEKEMELDTCVSDLDLEVAAAMSRCGIPTALRVRCLATAQNIAVDESFQTQTSRVSLATGAVLVLEPTHSEGIYRALPAMSRVRSFIVTLLVPPTVPFPSNSSAKLELALVTNPYATTITADAATFQCVAIAEATVSAATKASIPLKQSSLGSFNRMAEPGIQTTFTVLVPWVNGLPAPLVFTEPRYPALHFTGAALFPPEIQITITVSYEVARVV